MRSNGAGAESAANPRGDAEQRRADRDPYPEIATSEFFDISAVPENDSDGDDERDDGKAADQSEVQQCDAIGGKKTNGEESGEEAEKGNANGSAKGVAEFRSAMEGHFDPQVYKRG